MPDTIITSIPPPFPAPGDEWQNTLNNKLYRWIIGPSQHGAWVQVPGRRTPPPPPTPKAAPPPVATLTNAPTITNATPRHTMSDVPPAAPAPGDFWWDTRRGFLFTWYNDGNTIQWVVANPGQGKEEGPPGETGDTGPPGIHWVGTWDAITQYMTGDGVEHLGSSYYAVSENNNQAPDLSPTVWSLLAAKGDQGDPGGGVTITEGTGIDVTGGPDYIISVDPTASFPPTPHSHPQSAILNLVSDLALKAPLASPVFTGDPQAPTPATSDNDTSVATTAWGRAAIALYAPVPDLTPYEQKANKGVASGYAPLDATTKVPAAFLPAYVDDVLEFANLGAFPPTGSTSIIYVALDTNKIYRWSGSIYVEISPSPGSTDAVPEGATNKYYTDERVDDRVDALIVAGSNITKSYNDVANTLTIAAAAYPTALPPNGPAGGDLSGTYPNPLIKPSATNGHVLTTLAGVASWAAASGGASISVGTTPPGSPTAGALWWNSDASQGGGQLFIWYSDGTGPAQWVPASPGAASATTPGGDFCAIQTSSFFALTATAATILFTQVITGNSGGWYNSATGRYTPPAGRYRISAALSVQSATTSHVDTYLRKNGVQVMYARDTTGAANFAANSVVDVIVDANGTDWFDVQGAVSGGAAITPIHYAFQAFPLSGIKGPPGDLPSGAMFLYSEAIATAGATELRVTIPANPKYVELQFALRDATGAANAQFRLNGMVGNTPDVTAAHDNVSFYEYNSPVGLTPNVNMNYTSMILATGIFSSGRVSWSEVNFNIGSAYQQVGFFDLMGIEAPSGGRITYRGMVTKYGPEVWTGYRIEATVRTMAAGSYLRCFVVV